MKVTWLGQNGLLFEVGNTVVLVDPYLSDAVEKAQGPSKRRNMPIAEHFLELQPDVLLITHAHLDHLDLDTLQHYLKRPHAMQVLGPQSVWSELRKHGGNHNYVLMDRHTEFSTPEVLIEGVKAFHSDPFALGYLLRAQGQTHYISGDTLMNRDILEDLPPQIDVAYLPINGTGNNMNGLDAARFAQATGALKVVPVHWGLFDHLDPHDWSFPHKVIPHIYKEIAL